eukprot:scpid35799/ scgid33374/ 
MLPKSTLKQSSVLRRVMKTSLSAQTPSYLQSNCMHPHRPYFCNKHTSSIDPLHCSRNIQMWKESSFDEARCNMLGKMAHSACVQLACDVPPQCSDLCMILLCMSLRFCAEPGNTVQPSPVLEYSSPMSPIR